MVILRSCGNFTGFFAVICILFFLAGCGGGSSSDKNTAEEPERVEDENGGDVPSDDSPTITPVYVTVAGHIEDGRYYSDCERYPEYGNKLLRFADFIKSYDIPFNLQIDYELFIGALNCETAEMKSETGGVNMIDYIASNYDFRIDAHQGGGWEEGSENYADVRYVGGQATSRITENVGGVVWDLPEQFERFNAGESGLLYPEFVWFPEILTLGVHTNHHLGDFSLDDLTSGVWKPKGFGDDFLTHGPGARMIYIGPGMQHSDWFGGKDLEFQYAADYVAVLAEYLEEGRIPSGKIYTATIAVPQTIILDESRYGELEAQFERLSPLVDEGRAIYAHYREIADIWKNQYDSEPNVFTFDNIDPADYTIPDNDSVQTPEIPDSPEPVHVSVVLHYEESFVQTAPYFLKQRKDLTALAEFLHENGIKLNLQPDWAFMQAVNDFEDALMRESTNGKNILRYLVEDLGHEIDPHAHEHGYNYADVAFMIDELGVEPGSIAGGLIVDPPEDSKYDYLTKPIEASRFDYTWRAKWLWGAATAGHVNDTAAAGIWRPKDAFHFYENDDNAPLPCIGGYTSDIEGVYDLVEKARTSEIEPGFMLTASIFIGQGEVPDMHRRLAAELETLKQHEDKDYIVFTSLSESARIWTEQYEGKGYLYIVPRSYDLSYAPAW